MERRLIVMRHADSPKGGDVPSDHERPLSGRGKQEADEIARRLVDAGWEPRLVLSSDAERTRQTFEAMAPHFEQTPEVVFTESLYLAGLDAIEEALEARAGETAPVMVLGHNPGWQAAVSYLGGRKAAMMTANAALLSTRADSWSNAVEPDRFELERVLRPREL